MLELQYLIFAVIILALVFDFINGFHDTANAIATSVSTRALQPNHAIIMAAMLNFLGAMVSTGVAKTIGGDIVSSASIVDEKIIMSALIGAIIWNLLTWWLGIPSSSSHALVGGLIGAVLISIGAEGLNLVGIGKIIVSLIASPCIAIVTGIIIMNILFRMFEKSNPHAVNDKFRKLQVLSAATMAFSHGSNDAQKSMGIITLALFSGGMISEFEVPTYNFMRDGNGDRDSDGRLANNQDNRRENLQIGVTERVCGRFELVNRSIRRNTPAFACFDDACSIRLDNGRGNSQKNQRGTLGSGSTNGESVDNDDTNYGGNRRGLIFDCRTHFRIKKAADRIVRRNFFV